MPHGIFTLGHVSQYKIIQTFELNVLDYFNIISIIIIIIILKSNIGTCGSTSFVINCDQNSCILVTCDNTYIMESKDEFVFVDFFFHSIPFVICD